MGSARGWGVGGQEVFLLASEARKLCPAWTRPPWGLRASTASHTSSLQSLRFHVWRLLPRPPGFSPPCPVVCGFSPGASVQLPSKQASLVPRLCGGEGSGLGSLGVGKRAGGVFCSCLLTALGTAGWATVALQLFLDSPQPYQSAWPPGRVHRGRNGGPPVACSVS